MRCHKALFAIRSCETAPQNRLQTAETAHTEAASSRVPIAKAVSPLRSRRGPWLSSWGAQRADGNVTFLTDRSLPAAAASHILGDASAHSREARAHASRHWHQATRGLIGVPLQFLERVVDGRERSCLRPARTVLLPSRSSSHVLLAERKLEISSSKR